MTQMQTTLANARKRKLRPTGTTFRALGEELAGQIPALATYDEIGRAICVPTNMARHLTNEALGKLAWLCRQSLQQDTL